MGHPVVDEYATISSPVFLTPRSLLGKIYNAGISLGHLRGQEMALDLGWPPLCVGVDLPMPEVPEDWERQLLRAIVHPDGGDLEIDPLASRVSARRPSHEVEAYRWADATVIAISEPLLPRQLQRVCEAVKTPVAVAVALGNRIERSDGGSPQSVRVVSEAVLGEILKTVEGLY